MVVLGYEVWRDRFRSDPAVLGTAVRINGQARTVVGVRGGRPVSEDGTEVACATVIWCTGFHSGFDWIDLPVLDEHGTPRHRFGKASDMEGLYFTGLPFQYAVSSPLVSGVGRDARRVADWIAASH